MKLTKETKNILWFWIILYIKSIAFTFILASNTGNFFYGVSYDYRLVIFHLAILGIIILPALLFKQGRNKYLIIVDFIYTIILIADLWSYRASGYLFDTIYFFNSGLFNPLRKSLFNPRIIDIIFYLDFIYLGYLYKNKKVQANKSRNLIKGILGISICICIVFVGHYVIDIKGVNGSDIRFLQESWETTWSTATKISCRSPLGHHVYEFISSLKDSKKEANESQMKEVDEWLDWKYEKLPDNEYKGIAKGKNIVFLQIESLENFVINQKVNGQEITPVLNNLVNTEALYFSNIYEQNNGGNSIDCDMMVNTGLLTLGDSITFLSHPQVKYNSLARVLNSKGYTTVSTHAERSGDWGWAQAHKYSLDFDNMWDINKYNIDEKVGFGLSDRSFYKQYSEKLTSLKQPFFSMIPTLSSHGPFDIDDEYRELKLPEQLDSNRLGGYFQSVHYADKQIGYFIELLKKNGLYDNTIIVIYGDHGGVHKYYMDDVNETNCIGGDWWKKNKHQVPLLICGKGIPNETKEVNGGHIDIMPTVSYLLGYDTSKWTMGRNLLNTKKDVSVIKGGIVVGNPTKEEKVMYGKAYKIADYIIKNKYYENRGLIINNEEEN